MLTANSKFNQNSWGGGGGEEAEENNCKIKKKCEDEDKDDGATNRVIFLFSFSSIIFQRTIKATPKECDFLLIDGY